MPQIVLRNLSKDFDGTAALRNINLEIERGELISLLGPSGCGKTTTIRIIAGFLQPSSGAVIYEGKDITRLPPQKRNFGMVFQNYALFPHLNVFENVAFGLKAQGAPSSEVRRTVSRALELVNLPDYGHRQIHELSGGEQQRVAIARAIAFAPQVLLLDEPLSNLDAALRERTRAQLRELIKRLQITSIFVTHDQEEAFALSDRIAVINQGVCQQVGAPEELYDNPANEFVASFLGRSNFLEARIEAINNGHLACRISPEIVILVPAGGANSSLAVGEEVRLMVRPEAVQLRARQNRAGGISGRVLSKRFAGAMTIYLIEVDGHKVQSMLLSRADRTSFSVGEQVEALIPGESIRLFPAHTDWGPRRP